MRILVTGGAGFIGSHLVDRLVEMGNDVVILDNMSCGRKEHINKKAAFIQGDVRDAFDVRKSMEGCSVVFHLAGVADVSGDEDIVYKTNFLAAKNVFDTARQKNARVIFSSSAAVYGNIEVPHSETSDCRPLSQYGKSKLRAERYLEANNKDFAILRFFNVYGVGGNSVVNSICKKILNYEDIIIYGNGIQTRDYVHVSDVVDALIFAVDHDVILCNVGTGRETSLTSLIDTIHGMTRHKPSLKFVPQRPGDIFRSRADTRRMASLGLTTKVTLEEGLKDLLKAYGWKPEMV